MEKITIIRKRRHESVAEVHEPIASPPAAGSAPWLLRRVTALVLAGILTGVLGLSGVSRSGCGDAGQPFLQQQTQQAQGPGYSAQQSANNDIYVRGASIGSSNGSVHGYLRRRALQHGRLTPAVASTSVTRTDATASGADSESGSAPSGADVTSDIDLNAGRRLRRSVDAGAVDGSRTSSHSTGARAS